MSKRPDLCQSYLPFAIGIAAACLGIMENRMSAEVPHALAAGSLPPDSRLEPLKDLNGYFPFSPQESSAAWTERAEKLRQQLLVAVGLWPMPDRTPLNPIVHGLVDRGDYTVERVAIETLPGFYLTGSLYRPKGTHGRVPAVLSPHGHWADGRFYDNGVEATAKEIETGAERFAEGGRSPLQARMVQLARMGCVGFHYDMIGYADNTQLSYELAHRFAKQRPEMNTRENWGLFSPRAESHLQSIMTLQTWNSMRALDFVLSLPDVDGSRIGITGASGGGTQTFIMGALDPRPTVLFPAVMVSTAMQGGCTCENSTLLRIGTGNVEFAALAAPKPYGMTGANDWTVDMANKGFPELRKHFAMLGAEDHVHLTALNQFGHNYNSPSRHAMYHWMNQHLQLGIEEPIKERDFKRLTTEEMTVWGSSHPKPESGDDFERKLLLQLHDDAQAKIAADPDIARIGIETILGRTLAEVGEVDFEFADNDSEGKSDRTSYWEMVGILHNRTHLEAVPAVFLHPKDWNGTVALWLHGKGKSGLFNVDGSPAGAVQKLIAKGVSVAGIDTLYQGEFLKDGVPLTKTPVVDNPREAACYTFGYNHSVFAQRVHDALSAISFIRDHEYQPKRIVLIGSNGAGHIAAAAGSQATSAVHGYAIDTAGFRFIDIDDIHSPDFTPGGAKYGDLPGILARLAPTPMLLGGEKFTSTLLNLYQGAHAEALLTTGTSEDFSNAVSDWVE
ncbi:MAG: acetylxylan esterase [Verrucomicrobiae bacterium]|nr:acetylxylan esterase [Verrucomicrobiae bacterium]